MTHSISDSDKSSITQLLNLQFTLLLGPCPLNSNGTWLQYFESEQSPEGVIVFPVLSISDARQLASELVERAKESKPGQLTQASYQTSDTANS